MDIKNVMVAGCGVLGSQIAFQTAYKGFNVKVWLRSEASIERAKPKLERLKDTYLSTLEAMKTHPSAYARGLAPSPDLSSDEIDKLKENVQKAAESLVLTTDLDEAVKDADLAIEAIIENLEEKNVFFQKLAEHLPAKTILATNSSTLLPSQMAPYTGRPEKFLATHFSNQIWRCNTTEIMGQPKTDPAVYSTAVEFAEAIGMVPIEIKKEQPGYILNSMLTPLLTAAQMLYATGVADFETIDKTWTLATGAPLGPVRILDFVGLTTAYNIGAMDPQSQDPSSMTSKIGAILKERIDAGKTGVDAGEGFYKYD